MGSAVVLFNRVLRLHDHPALATAVRRAEHVVPLFVVDPAIVEGGFGAPNRLAFLAETLAELNITQAQFARAIGVSPMRVSHVIHGTRPVTAELALLFGRALDQSPQYWLNLQATYDLKAAEVVIGPQLRTVTRLASV